MKTTIYFWFIRAARLTSKPYTQRGQLNLWFNGRVIFHKISHRPWKTCFHEIRDFQLSSTNLVSLEKIFKLYCTFLCRYCLLQVRLQHVPTVGIKHWPLIQHLPVFHSWSLMTICSKMPLSGIRKHFIIFLISQLNKSRVRTFAILVCSRPLVLQMSPRQRSEIAASVSARTPSQRS